MNLMFFYCSDINPLNGGVQRVTHDLSNYFILMGHKVIYLASQSIKTPYKIIENQYYLPNCKQIISKENTDFFNNLVNKNSIHIVINQDGMDPRLTNFCIYQKKRHLNIKFISVIHNSLLGNAINFSSSHSYIIKRIPIPYLNKLLQTNFFSIFLLKAYKIKYKKHYTKTCNEFNKVVLLSESFYSELNFFVKNIKKNIVTSISNPCTLQTPSTITIKENEILYVGRINTSQKRVDLLLEIWKNIYKKFPTWKLSIIGDGEERAKLEKISKDLGLSRITFFGLQNPIDYYERSKILCMTSAYEGFGLVLVEAQKFGTIPIAFDSFSSVKDIINDGENGLLIKPFDIDLYVTRLTDLMNNQEKIGEMSLNCKKSVENFSIYIIGAKWLSLFELLLKNDE